MIKYIRKLARSGKYQLLYAKTKEISNIRIFENDINFSGLQLEFLYWLSVYNNLYQDLAMKEKYLTKEVINDDIECDAYVYWKSKQKDKKEIKEVKTNVTGIPSLIQKRKRNRRGR